MHITKKLPLALAGFSALGVLAAGAPTALAGGPSNPPQHVTIEDDFTFQSRRLTQACGFPVFGTVQGTLNVVLRTDRNGVLVETDAFTDWRLSFSAPSTGNSFSYKFGPTTFVYPQGTFIGAPSVVTLYGVQANYPGAPAEAGRLVIAGEVIDISPEGIPLVEFVGQPTSNVGNVLSVAESTFNLCEALAG
jgi:hypothetical protein